VTQIKGGSTTSVEKSAPMNQKDKEGIAHSEECSEIFSVEDSGNKRNKQDQICPLKSKYHLQIYTKARI